MEGGIEEPAGSDGLVSICIPTFERPQLIRETIASCLAQTHRPIEILIGDDSRTSETEDLVRSLPLPEGIVIRHERNRERLGQSGNVNRLFHRAAGRYLLLIHDDDLMCPGGLDLLLAALATYPSARCVYGLQYVIAPGGTVLLERSAAWNARDRRVPDHAGPQPSPLRAALWQHVPNDGYLIDSRLAREIGYKHEREVGHAVDADFIIEAAKGLAPGDFVFVDAFICKYRLTPGSIARSPTINRRQDMFFMSLSRDETLRREDEARNGLLRRIATGAALDAAMAGRRRDALRILFSRHYDRPRFSRWTLYRLVCILSPRLGLRLKSLIGGA
ncbi:hypothetical protein GCM10011390_19860 [Aureimonas endophytica]|uniref:Glycosyltransferase 2-like domain-containing protein n=1 Tax=Aureimonas endophytica TaxID=2027858 RepID=A0A916ZJJ6_9HYPH|nr:glycosyltransferase [Aureimonas endophytica]GGE01059.1 hypothetical protein GCM10011390_19860 [Aureimonas endophytica]